MQDLTIDECDSVDIIYNFDAKISGFPRMRELSDSFPVLLRSEIEQLLWKCPFRSLH